MKSQKIIKQHATFTNFNKPFIRDLEFPKMRNRLSIHEIKEPKKFQLSIEDREKTLETTNSNMARSFSFSIINCKKNTSLNLSPVKAPPNTERFQVKFIKKKKQDNPFLQKCIIKNSQQYLKEQIEKQVEKNIKAQRFNQNSYDQPIITKRQYPTVKFQTPQIIQKRNSVLNKLLPSLTQKLNSKANFLQDIRTARTQRKTPLFNGKNIYTKRYKQQLPDELITRKLIWQGRQVRRIDHYQIHKDLIQKSKIQKQTTQQTNPQKTQDQKFLEFKILNGWDQEDVKYNSRFKNNQ